MVRREHNSKLIVTMPTGAQTIGNTDGTLYFKYKIFKFSVDECAHCYTGQIRWRIAAICCEFVKNSGIVLGICIF